MHSKLKSGPAVTVIPAHLRPGDMDKNPALRLIRGLIWVYLLMLLFEGAFRKWIMPGLSTPLLVIRDPVVILIYLFSLTAGIFPKNRFVFWLIGITCLAAVFGLAAEQFSPGVYLFGLRTDFLHLPLIFVMPRVMTQRHVVTMGRCILILSIPMAALIAKQFEAGAEDILNTTAGGTGLQLNTSGGKVRASGTFTFVTGVVAFCGLVAAFLMHSLLRPGSYSRWLQIAGAASLIISVATSGSRSAVGAVLVVCVVTVSAALMRPRLLIRSLLVFTFMFFVTAIVLQLGVVREGVDVMSMRFEEAGGNGGIWPRIFGSFYDPLESVMEAPFFGCGLGLGTNAGAMLATGSVNFLLGEDDWSRVIMESGGLVGLLFIGWRVAVVIFLLRVSVRSLKVANALPFFLLGASASFILQGQLGQPTILGFAAYVGGLCLAAANDDYSKPLTTAPSQKSPEVKSAVPRRVRGRSIYAEALHGGRK